jgi:hypothetical protein
LLRHQCHHFDCQIVGGDERNVSLLQAEQEMRVAA